MLTELYSKLHGDVALVAKQVGMRKHHILLGKETQQARLRRAISLATVVGERRQDGTDIMTVKEFAATIRQGD